ncbi:hypothetical protein L7F22_014987 [Adiantum nelumboides]|nr:hypothetical protein [Adiantum nelumboides]
MCCSFGSRQARFEQATRVGAVAFHCDRRARVFDRDIRRLGTAMMTLLGTSNDQVCPPGSGLTWSRRSVGGGQALTERRPTRIQCLMPVIRREIGPPLAALDAQTGAVLAAQGRHRELGDDRVAHGLGEVDALVDQARDLVGVGGLLGDRVRVGEQLADPDLHVLADRLQAARALPRQPGIGRAGDVDALGHRLQGHVELDVGPAGDGDHPGQADLGVARRRGDRTGHAYAARSVASSHVERVGDQGAQLQERVRGRRAEPGRVHPAAGGQVRVVRDLDDAAHPLGEVLADPGGVDLGAAPVAGQHDHRVADEVAVAVRDQPVQRLAGPARAVDGRGPDHDDRVGARERALHRGVHQPGAGVGDDDVEEAAQEVDHALVLVLAERLTRGGVLLRGQDLQAPGEARVAGHVGPGADRVQIVQQLAHGDPGVAGEPVGERAGVGVGVEDDGPVAAVLGQCLAEAGRDRGLADAALHRHDRHPVRPGQRRADPAQQPGAELLGVARAGVHTAAGDVVEGAPPSGARPVGPRTQHGVLTQVRRGRPGVPARGLGAWELGPRGVGSRDLGRGCAGFVTGAEIGGQPGQCGVRVGPEHRGGVLQTTALDQPQRGQSDVAADQAFQGPRCDADELGELVGAQDVGAGLGQRAGPVDQASGVGDPARQRGEPVPHRRGRVAARHGRGELRHRRAADLLGGPAQRGGCGGREQRGRAGPQQDADDPRPPGQLPDVDAGARPVQRRGDRVGDEVERRVLQHPLAHRAPRRDVPAGGPHPPDEVVEPDGRPVERDLGGTRVQVSARLDGHRPTPCRQCSIRAVAGRGGSSYGAHEQRHRRPHHRRPSARGHLTHPAPGGIARPRGDRTLLRRLRGPGALGHRDGRDGRARRAGAGGRPVHRLRRDARLRPRRRPGGRPPGVAVARGVRTRRGRGRRDAGRGRVDGARAGLDVRVRGPVRLGRRPVRGAVGGDDPGGGPVAGGERAPGRGVGGAAGPEGTAARTDPVAGRCAAGPPVPDADPERLVSDGDPRCSAVRRPGDLRPVLRPRSLPLAFATASVSFVLVSVAAGVPAPLYVVYQRSYGISTVALTGAFAVYVVPLLVALLCCGSLSDHVGRRRVAVPALIVGAVACLVLATVDSSAPLIIGRAVQGVSVGLALAALGGYVVDLAPPSRPGLAGAITSGAPPGGIALGALASGAAVQLAPDGAPVRSFVVAAGLLVVAAAALALLPETAARRPGALRSLRPEVRVPRAARRLFPMVCVVVAATYVLGGFTQALAPSLAASVLGRDDLFSGALAVAVYHLAGPAAGLAAARLPAARALTGGAVVLAAGTAGFVGAIALGSFAAYLVRRGRGRGRVRCRVRRRDPGPARPEPGGHARRHPRRGLPVLLPRGRRGEPARGGRGRRVGPGAGGLGPVRRGRGDVGRGRRRGRAPAPPRGGPGVHPGAGAARLRGPSAAVVRAVLAAPDLAAPAPDDAERVVQGGLQLAQGGVDVVVALPAQPVGLGVCAVDDPAGLGVRGADDLGLGDQAGLLVLSVGDQAVVRGPAGVAHPLGLVPGAVASPRPPRSRRSGSPRPRARRRRRRRHAGRGRPGRRPARRGTPPGRRRAAPARRRAAPRSSTSSGRCAPPRRSSPARPATRRPGTRDGSSHRHGRGPVIGRRSRVSGEPVQQPGVHARREERGDVAAAAGDLLDQRARHVDLTGRAGQEQRLDPGQVPVHVRHRELVVVVRRPAQALDHRPGAALAAVVDDEPLERLDPHARQVRGDLGEHRDALVDGEQPLLAGVHQDRDEHLVEQRRGAGDDVEVTDRRRVVGTGADGATDLGHGRNLSAGDHRSGPAAVQRHVQLVAVTAVARHGVLDRPVAGAGGPVEHQDRVPGGDPEQDRRGLVGLLGGDGLLGAVDGEPVMLLQDPVDRAAEVVDVEVPAPAVGPLAERADGLRRSGGERDLEDDRGRGQPEPAHVVVEGREVQAGARGAGGDVGALAADPGQQPVALQLADGGPHRHPAHAVVQAQPALAGEGVAGREVPRDRLREQDAELLVLGHDPVADPDLAVHGARAARVVAQHGRGHVGRDRSGHRRRHGRAFALPGRDEDDPPGLHDRGRPLGQHPVRHVLGTVEEAGVVGAGPLGQRRDPGARVERRAGLVEPDVPVAADAEDLQVHRAARGEQPFVVRRCPGRVRAGAVRGVHRGRVDVEVVGELAADDLAVGLRVPRGQAQVLVEQEGAGPGEGQPLVAVAADQLGVGGQRGAAGGEPEGRRPAGVPGQDVGDGVGDRPPAGRRVRVGDEHVGAVARGQRPDLAVEPEEPGRGAGRGEHRVLQPDPRVAHRGAHDVDQARGAARDGPVRDPRDTVVDPDLHRAQVVAAVGHPGGGHRVGDQRDPVRPDQVEHRGDGVGRQVHPVRDELHDELAPAGRGQARRDRPGRPVVHRGHRVEQVGGAHRRAARPCDPGRGGAGVGVGVADARQHPVRGEHREQVRRVRGLRRVGHRRDGPVGLGEQLVEQRRVAREERTRVVRAAPRGREERSLQVDPGEVPGDDERAQRRDPLRQHGRRGGDQRGEDRRRAAGAVVGDGGRRPRRRRVREAVPGAAVVVHVDQSRQQQRRRRGRERTVVRRGREDRDDPVPRDRDDRVREQPAVGDDAPPGTRRRRYGCARCSPAPRGRSPVGPPCGVGGPGALGGRGALGARGGDGGRCGPGAGGLVVLPAGGAEVPATDHEAEQHVVDDGVGEPDRDQPQRPGGLAEVEDVVDRAGGEGEPVVDAERVDQRERGAGEHRVDQVQRPRHVDEGVLQRLGDAGDEGGQRDRHHDPADELALLRAGLVPDREGRGGQREHHDREEAGHEGPGGRVAGEEAVQVAAGAVEVPDDEPDDRVDDVVQPDGQQQPVDQAEDPAADDGVLPDGVAQPGQPGVEHRVDQAHDRRDHHHRHGGEDRDQPAAVEEAEEGRQRRAVEALPQQCRDQARDDAAQHPEVDRGLLALRVEHPGQQHRGQRGEHAVHHERLDAAEQVVLPEAQQQAGRGQDGDREHQAPAETLQPGQPRPSSYRLRRGGVSAHGLALLVEYRRPDGLGGRCGAAATTGTVWL